MWEISENLHRAELTVLERDTQVARWIELRKLLQPATVSGGRGNEGEFFRNLRKKKGVGSRKAALMPQPVN
jgi:hypothetical protein